MFQELRNRERTERTERTETDSTAGASADATLFRVGRGIFGGILAFMAVDNLRNLDERVGYADAKGAPSPEITVPGTSIALLLGSVGVALWRLPAAAAGAVAWFFASVTPIMHDFWNLDDPEQQQQQLLHFLKNTALFGAALAFLKVGQRED